MSQLLPLHASPVACHFPEPLLQVPGEPREKPEPGVWRIEVPKGDRSTVQVPGLVDRAHPDLIMPINTELGYPGSMLRPTHGLCFCICGTLAVLPFLVVGLLKLRQPLIVDNLIPRFLDAYNSSGTISDFVGDGSTLTEGRHDLRTTDVLLRGNIALVLLLGAAVALPWWLLRARWLLSRSALTEKSLLMADAEAEDEASTNDGEDSISVGETTPLMSPR